MSAPPPLLREVTSSWLGSFSISAKTGSGDGAFTEAGVTIFSARRHIFLSGGFVRHPAVPPHLCRLLASPLPALFNHIVTESPCLLSGQWESGGGTEE